MKLKTDTRIYIAGHNGLVGSAVLNKLKSFNFPNILYMNKSELDLRDFDQTLKFFSKYKPEIVIDAAAKVGGIFANDSKSGEFIKDNLSIQINLIEASRLTKVKLFVFLGSVCIYPKFAPIPVKESSLLTGPLELTNEAYAIAKISGIYMLRAYYKQFGLRSVSLMPSNIYGPNDNFNPEFGHVIPALLRKMSAHPKQITLWGDGSPFREFLFSEDLADAIWFIINSGTNMELMNVGSGVNISIKDLADLIAKITGFQGEINWDHSRPNGTPNRLLDSSKLNQLGWKPKTDLESGLRKTWDWLRKKNA